MDSIEFMLSQSTVDVQEPSVIIQFYSCKYGYYKAVDLKIKKKIKFSFFDNYQYTLKHLVYL